MPGTLSIEMVGCVVCVSVHECEKEREKERCVRNVSGWPLCSLYMDDWPERLTNVCCLLHSFLYTCRHTLTHTETVQQLYFMWMGGESLLYWGHHSTIPNGCRESSIPVYFCVCFNRRQKLLQQWKLSFSSSMCFSSLVLLWMDAQPPAGNIP